MLLRIPSFYVPNIVIYHLSSPTLQWSKKKFFLLERNRWICLLSLYSSKTLFTIFPLLILVEFGILFYYIKKGMGLTKLRSLISIIKLLSYIQRRKKRINLTRKILDKELINDFVDGFDLPVNTVDRKTAQNVSQFIKSLSRLARKLFGN